VPWLAGRRDRTAGQRLLRLAGIESTGHTRRTPRSGRLPTTSLSSTGPAPYRLHVHVLDADPLRFAICWTDCCGLVRGQRPEDSPDTRRRVGHPQDMETGRCPDWGVCAAVDVRYLSTGARVAAVLAVDAAFARVLAERTAVIPWVPPCRPGEFYRRELPALCAVLEDLTGLGLPVVDGYADLDPAAGLGAGARRVRRSGDRGGQVAVPRGDPCGAGPARILGAPPVCHRGRDARSRRGGPGPADDRPVPAARRTAPRRHPRPGWSLPAATMTGRQPEWVRFDARAPRCGRYGGAAAGRVSWI
jgi:hypothetical protein